MYYYDLFLIRFTFVKVELRVQGTYFYGDAGEFDGRRGINLGIWSNGYIMELTIVASVLTGITGSLQQNRLITSNQTVLMICIVII